MRTVITTPDAPGSPLYSQAVAERGRAEARLLGWSDVLPAGVALLVGQ